jgi:hypothetical protein
MRDSAPLTGNPEVIGSSAGLVPRNALVLTEPINSEIIVREHLVVWLTSSVRLPRNGVLGDWDFRLSQCTRTGVGYNSYVGIGPRTTETFRRGLKIVEAILAEFSSYLLIKRSTKHLKLRVRRIGGIASVV